MCHFLVPLRRYVSVCLSWVIGVFVHHSQWLQLTCPSFALFPLQADIQTWQQPSKHLLINPVFSPVFDHQKKKPDVLMWMRNGWCAYNQWRLNGHLFSKHQVEVITVWQWLQVTCYTIFILFSSHKVLWSISFQLLNVWFISVKYFDMFSNVYKPQRLDSVTVSCFPLRWCELILRNWQQPCF